jgi:hypothetical protein
MYEYVLQGLELSASDQHVPGGEEHERSCRSLGVVQPTGKWEDVAMRDRDPFGVAAVTMLSQDSVAATAMVGPGDAMIAVTA